MENTFEDTTLLTWYKDLHEKIPFFRAIADDERLRILMHLFTAADSGMNVTELASKSHLSRPAVSHHLKILKDAGLIEPNKKATQIFYVLKTGLIFESLKTILTNMADMLNSVDLEQVRKEATESTVLPEPARKSWILPLVPLRNSLN